MSVPLVQRRCVRERSGPPTTCCIAHEQRRLVCARGLTAVLAGFPQVNHCVKLSGAAEKARAWIEFMLIGCGLGVGVCRPCAREGQQRQRWGARDGAQTMALQHQCMCSGSVVQWVCVSLCLCACVCVPCEGSSLAAANMSRRSLLPAPAPCSSSPAPALERWAMRIDRFPGDAAVPDNAAAGWQPPACADRQRLCALRLADASGLRVDGLRGRSHPVLVGGRHSDGASSVHLR